MPMVGMMLAVTYSPAMVRHKDGGMRDVTHQVVELTAVAEALMPTA